MYNGLVEPGSTPGPCPDRLDVVSYFDGSCRFALEASRVSEKKTARLDAGDKVWLCLRGSHDPRREIEVREPVELISLQAEQIHPVPHLIACQCTIPGLRALAFDARGLILIVEPV